MVRTWYPAASAGGPRRPYLVGEEERILAWFLEMARVPAEWIGWLRGTTTWSVQDAAPAAGSYPVVVFSHGATGWVSQNTPLMEHLASHGYVVWSLAHPGEAAGVAYEDGTVVRCDEAFLNGMLGPAGTAYQERLTADLERRLEVTPLVLDAHGMGPWARRWVDDTRALLDALGDGAVRGAAAALVAGCDLDRIATAGMSFGGASAASTAHTDARVAAAVNLDGAQFLSDLLDTDIRVPLLHLATDGPAQMAAMGVEGVTTLDANEFFYERLAYAGTRPHVRRLRLPGVAHLELTDLLLVPAAERRALPAGGTAEGQPTLDRLNELVRGFLDEVLLGVAGPAPDLEPVDLAPIRAWAAARAQRRR